MTPGTSTLDPVRRGDTWRGITRIQRHVRGDLLTVATNAATDVATLADHGLVDAEAVVVSGAGLTADAIHYVIAATDDTFQLALTEGGAAVPLTTAASVSVWPLEAPSTAVASARMQFRLDGEDGPLVLALTSEDDGGLVIDDADLWIFSVPARAAGFAKAGTLYWDLEVTDEDDAVITWLAGTIDVSPDVTR